VRVTGVDGCRGGWVAAHVDNGSVGWSWTETAAPLLSDRAVSAVAIDIPIGLPDVGVRACDVEARRRLPGRASSVFAAPVRPVLDCKTYGEARELLTSLGGASMSAQAFGVVAAVRDVDNAVTPADEQRVIEVHPELVFARLGGGAPAAPKKSAPGVAQRLRLLTSWLPGVVEAVTACPRAVPIDDALDALACAWLAERWSAHDVEVLGDGGRDARGLVMRIVT
jgi:predicted RNase H-like nuclease